MKILLTGGAGFIGSHVADVYIRAGHRVAVLDDLSSGSRKNLNPRAKFYKGDIRDPKLVRLILKKERPEAINHHAAQVSVVRSVRDPGETMSVNVLGTVNLLSALAESGRKAKFIFASTGGAIYGGPRKLPASEKTPANPLAPYGFSKLLAEKCVRFFAEQGGFPYVILRYANVFGPRQDPAGEAGVIAIFLGLMREGRRPVIFGDGTKTRDYVFVGDIARANFAALRRGEGLAMNLGTGKQVSDLDVFRAAAARAGFKGEPRFAPFRSGETRRISLDARLARRILNWTPRFDLTRGMREIDP